MWHGGDGHNGVDALRHECTEGGGVGPFGWVEHDGRSYGKQEIADAKAGVRLITSMVKPAQLMDHGSSLLGAEERAEDGACVQAVLPRSSVLEHKWMRLNFVTQSGRPAHPRRLRRLPSSGHTYRSVSLPLRSLFDTTGCPACLNPLLSLQRTS